MKVYRMHFHRNGFLSFVFLFSLIQIWCGLTQLVLSQESDSDVAIEDIILRANKNVMPVPVENLKAMKHPPPELSMDPTKVLAQQLFEGCITLDQQDTIILEGENAARSDVEKRRVITKEGKRWMMRSIPYEIVYIGLSDQEEDKMREQIGRVLRQLVSVSCLEFKPKMDGDSNWIMFYDGFGCHSDLGKKVANNAPTQISIGKGCQSDAVIMHLLLHALGILHEQNRIDRDSYINVQWENIKDDYREVFKRHQYNGIEILNGQYNYKSIMHFSKFAYSKANRRATILPKDDQTIEIGGKQLNELDIRNLKLAFHCSKFDWQEWGSWSPCSRPCGIGYHHRKRICGGNRGECNGGSVQLETCRVARCRPDPFDTTFEDDWGSWKARSHNKCNWRRGKTRKKLQVTGPQEDHTTGQGRFAQVRFGGACQTGIQATMRSIRIHPIYHERCLSFVYYMHRNGVGTLDVLMQDMTSRQQHSLWKKEGDQGKGWNQAAVTIPNIPVSYKLFIVATIGNDDVSDISVDDIYIDNGKCPEGLGECKDFNDQCPLWSSQGECYKNPRWMLLSCCKSCSVLPECVDKNAYCKEQAAAGKCHSNKKDMWKNCCKSCESCLDKDNRCSSWADAGECESNSDWMRQNCKKSCHVCRT